MKGLADSEWLDGPRFLAWLEESDGFVPQAHGPALERRATDWRGGAAVSVWKADEVLTHIGLHLSLIPDEIWLEGKPRYVSRAKRRPIYSKKKRAEVVRKLQAGEITLIELTRQRTGPSKRTVQRWMDDAKAKVEQ